MSSAISVRALFSFEGSGVTDIDRVVNVRTANSSAVHKVLLVERSRRLSSIKVRQCVETSARLGCSDSRVQARGQNKVDNLGNSLDTSPVTLKFTRQRHPADWLRSRLHDPLKTGSVGLGRRSSDSVDDGEDLVAFSHRVKRWIGEADLSPQGRHDQLIAARRLHRLAKLDILPGVDLSSVELDGICKDGFQFRECWWLSVRDNVHGRQHDWKSVGLGKARHRDDVAGQQLRIHRGDCRQLSRLVVNDD